MQGYFLAMAAAMALFVAVISYVVARRYGWLSALLLPLFALAASIGMMWQEAGADLQDGLGLVTSSLVFAAPTLIGAVVGIVVAVLRKA